MDGSTWNLRGACARSDKYPAMQPRHYRQARWRHFWGVHPGQAQSLSSLLCLVTFLIAQPASAAQFVRDPTRPIEPDPRPSTVLAYQGTHLSWTEFASGSTPATDVWNSVARAAGAGNSLALGPDLDGDCSPELLLAGIGPAAQYWISGNRQGGSSGTATLPRGLVWAVDPRSSKVLRAWQGAGAFDRMGTCMLTLDDLDGDGVGEIAITSPGAAEARGQVELFSSRDGSRLRVYVGEELNAGFGSSLVLLPDLDSDGLRDLAVGAPLGRGHESTSGCVLLLSTRTGEVLANIPGPQAGSAFGHALNAELDLTGDGIRDLLIGAPSFCPVPELPHAGLVLIVSPIDGLVAGVIEGKWPEQSLGVAVGALPAFDESPLGEVVVACGAHWNCGSARGVLLYFASPQFTLTDAWIEPPSCGSPDTSFGASLAVLDDLDGDGGLEVAVGAPTHDGCDDPWGMGFVCFSPGGECGERALVSRWVNREWNLGSFAAAIIRFPDLDGDDVDEYVIGAPDPVFNLPGGAQIRSGRRGGLLKQIVGEHLPVP